VAGVGLLLVLRFLYRYFSQGGFEPGMVQSLIMAAVLMIVGIPCDADRLLADVMSASRKLLEDVLYRVRRIEMGTRIGPQIRWR
jgi:hypothetical protein